MELQSGESKQKWELEWRFLSGEVRARGGEDEDSEVLAVRICKL